jgi:hypothetical protein
VTSSVTDFGNSYMTWEAPANLNDTRKPGHMPWGNSARILIDARCTIVDERAGTTDEFYLIAPCRTEWMYRETELIQNPSGEYRVIFSRDRQLSVGKWIDEDRPRDGSRSTSEFTALDFTIAALPATALPTDRAVVDATVRNLPVVARTELANAETGLRATLEYPVRTMNVHPERVRFQVDTGPLIFPDLAIEAESHIDRCKLAHTVYNTFDYAEFVCKQPTPLVRDGVEVASIFHYSDYRQLAVTNALFGVGGAR